MQKFDTEIELSVHTDTRSVFNVLCVDHNNIEVDLNYFLSAKVREFGKISKRIVQK